LQARAAEMEVPDGIGLTSRYKDDGGAVKLTVFRALARCRRRRRVGVTRCSRERQVFCRLDSSIGLLGALRWLLFL